MSRILGVVVVACLAASPAFADRPILALHPMHLDPKSVPSLVNSHVLYLNRCANGCTVHIGNPDSTTDTSDIGQGTLTPYRGPNWGQVVSCVKTIMKPFNIQVTDSDPGSTPHFEVMVAGSACQIIQDQSCQYIGGIADFACTSPGSCSPYIPNALVFDFSDSWRGSVTEDCGTIAQEIAHTWSLDHATPNNDPMTYNPLAPPLNYQDNAPCGSDCSSANGTSPFGLQCTNQRHTCMSSGQSTQNEVQIITKVFGPANAQPPSLSVTPADGSAEQPGFTVQANCSSSDGIQEVDFAVDGKPEASLTASPYKFTTATNLTDGSHTVDVLCGTNKEATASRTIHVIVGTKCSGDGDCMTNDICYENACIPGMNAAGGLGATCTGNNDCASGACGSDGSMQVCVVPCDPNNDHCPGGFGCLQSGSSGVCWPGAAHGSSGGGCDAGGGSPAGPLGLGLGLVALLVVRRRKTGDA